MRGLGIAAVYKFIADGLRVFPSEVDFEVKSYKGQGIGIDVLPALLGVGYICGVRVASYLLAGGVTAWFVIMPVIALFGEDAVLYPATVPISELGAWGIWSNYIRYIGAGAVAAGGIFSLIKALPLIIRTFAQAVRGYGKNMEEESRTSRGYPNPCCPCGNFNYRDRDVADPCDTGQFTGSNFNCSLRILFCNRIFQNGRVSRKFE